MTTSLLAELPLIDHHCHGVLAEDADRARMESLLGEGGPPPPGTSRFDSQLGFALRRWCAPVLDLDPHASPERYLERRTELGATEVTRRLLDVSGIVDFVLDTGFRADELLTPVQMAAAANARAHQVVRLEAVAEQLAGATTADGFADEYTTALEEATRDAVGLKSVAAYRCGLDFDPSPPSRTEVATATARWLRRIQTQDDGSARLDDPVLVRHLLWAGVDLGLPLQFHTGYGDRDLEIHRANPALLTDFIRKVQNIRTPGRNTRTGRSGRPSGESGETGVPVMLLHCYPFHRAAGYLAAVYPHVYMDVGLAVPGVGLRTGALLAEALELAPPAKLLFSTDAFGLPELYYLGARLFRRGLGGLLDAWVAEGAWAPADAERVAKLVAGGNARRVYGLTGG